MKKEQLNKFTELCNKLDSDTIIYCYGDFILQDLIKALQTLKLSDNPIKSIVYDANEIKLSDVLSSTVLAGGLTQYDYIYIIDNAEFLNKKEIDFLLKFKPHLKNASKLIILCSLVLDTRFNMFKKIKLGEIYDSKLQIQLIFAHIVNNPNRKQVINVLKNNEFSLQYLLSLLSYNLTFLYNDSNLIYNQKIIEKAFSFLFKVSTEIFLNFLIYNLRVSNVRKTLRFLPKLEVDKK